MAEPEPPARPPRRFALSNRALIVVIVVQLVLIAVLIVARRADQALGTIQQADPRRRATPAPATVRAPTSQPVISPTSQPATAVATRPPLATAPAATATTPGLLQRPFTMLLIGVDKRPDEEEGARSDTLIAVWVDPREKWASMLSIPRDSVVQIPHYGWAKINAAYSYGYAHAAELYGSGTSADEGGGALAAEAVEAFLGVPIDYTAQIDFDGFRQLVDAVGGVLVDVEKPVLDAEYPTDDYGIERLYIPAGLHVLDGRTALAYARSRHGSSDFERSKRQQQVLRAMVDEAQSRGLLANADLVTQLVGLAEQNIRTTLPVRDMAVVGGLVNLAREMSLEQVTQLSINPKDVVLSSENGSDLYWEPTSLAALVARWQSGPAGAEAAVVRVINASGIPGTATRVSAWLRAQGFTVELPDNAPRTYTQSTLVDYTGQPYTLKRLLQTLDLANDAVQPPRSAEPLPRGEADIVLVVGEDFHSEWVTE